MTCIESGCEQTRLVMPDNMALTVRWNAGQEFINVDTNPRGRTATPWCREHFPSWLWGTHRIPPTPKPQQSRIYGGMTDRMQRTAEAWAAATEAAVELTDALHQLVEAAGGEPA